MGEMSLLPVSRRQSNLPCVLRVSAGSSYIKKLRGKLQSPRRDRRWCKPVAVCWQYSRTLSRRVLTPVHPVQFKHSRKKQQRREREKERAREEEEEEEGDARQTDLESKRVGRRHSAKSKATSKTYRFVSEVAIGSFRGIASYGGTVVSWVTEYRDPHPPANPFGSSEFPVNTGSVFFSTVPYAYAYTFRSAQSSTKSSLRSLVNNNNNRSAEA